MHITKYNTINPDNKNNLDSVASCDSRQKTTSAYYTNPEHHTGRMMTIWLWKITQHR